MMNLKQAEKHVVRLKKIFPNSHISTTHEFYGKADDDTDNIGLWTGFLEDGTVNEWGHDNSGMGYFVEPKLQNYLKKHDLDMEAHDAGTMMIWDWS
jgi:hypothetical protein